jgi:hypothetical protein
MTKKITKKELALRFVESKGTARFVEIQEFIVDHNYGTGTYKKGWYLDVIYRDDPHGRRLPTAGFVNPNRGYYASVFSGPNPYFMYGEDYLEKMSDGRYRVVRGGNKPKPDYYSKWGSLYYRNYKQKS